MSRAELPPVEPTVRQAPGQGAPAAEPVDPAAAATPGGWQVLHPTLYCWFVLFAVLDIVCTYLILHPATFPPTRVYEVVGGAGEAIVVREQRMEGAELNPVADWVIHRFDVPGKVAYKLLLVVGVILICEYVGRRRPPAGRRLAEWAIALTVIPVVVALAQLGKYAAMQFTQ